MLQSPLACEGYLLTLLASKKSLSVFINLSALIRECWRITGIERLSCMFFLGWAMTRAADFVFNLHTWHKGEGQGALLE